MLVLLGEALVLPTGLVTLAFLTRWLGTTGYGLFTLASTLVVWIEWTICSIFGRATNRCVAEVEDWRPAAATSLRLFVLAGALAAAALVLLARPVAGLLGEPALAGHLRVFALDIPLFCAAQAHRDILVGLGGYRQRALLSAVRWLVRLALLLVLVGLGLSVRGAIWACIGTSAVELLVARGLVAPPLFARSAYRARRVLSYAAPLLVYAVCLRLFNRLDLVVLKALGASAAEAGEYGMAQNLSLVPGIFTMTFAPLLQSTLVRMLREGQVDGARVMTRDALRAGLLLVPFAAIVAGGAAGIVRFVSGAEFAGAAAPLRLLILGAPGLVLVGIAAAILVAWDRTRWTVAIAAPLSPLALAGLWAAVPRWGGAGAALVTAACSWVGAAGGMAAALSAARATLPVATIARVALVSVAACAAAALSPDGPWLLPSLAAVAGGAVLALLALGEFDARERAAAWSVLTFRMRST